jgi:hypothetical protein
MIGEFSTPSNTNIPTGSNMTVGQGNFELKPVLINMVQASPFCVQPNEDANAHLQHFLEVRRTFITSGETNDAIRLLLFPFSLLGKAKQWFYAERDAINTWDKCSTNATMLLEQCKILENTFVCSILKHDGKIDLGEVNPKVAAINKIVDNYLDHDMAKSSVTLELP